MHRRLVYLNIVIPVLLPIVWKLLPEGMTTAGILTMGIGLPAILIVLNFLLYFRGLETAVSKLFLFMLIGLLGGVGVNYCLAALSVQGFSNVDAETLWILQALVKYYAVVTIGTALCIYLASRLRSRFRKDQRTK